MVRRKKRRTKRSTKKINIDTGADLDQGVQRETIKIDHLDPLIVKTETVVTEEDGHPDLVAMKSPFRKENWRLNLQKKEILDLTLPCIRKGCSFLSKVGAYGVKTSQTKQALCLRLKRRLDRCKCSKPLGS